MIPALQKAIESHNDLKKNLVKSYPEAYDSKNDMIMPNKMPNNAQLAYNQSRTNRDTLVVLQQREDELKKAVDSHNQLEKNLKETYPQAYDPETDTLTPNNLPPNAKEQYDKSRANRDTAVANKEAAEQKTVSQKVAQVFPENKKAPVVKANCPFIEKPVEKQDIKQHWIKFNIQDEKSKPVPGVILMGVLPGGEKFSITLKEVDNGIINIPNIKSGSCKIESNWKNFTIYEAVLI